MVKRMGAKIKVLKNGPYEVSGEIPLINARIVVDEEGFSRSWQAGKSYETAEQSYHLCRCGHSEQKPFCDGTHEERGFGGEELALLGKDSEHTVRYDSETISLLDEEPLCAVLRFCDRGVSIWEAVTHSEEDDNEQLAIEEACNCAAGRLTIERQDKTLIEPELNQEISPVQDTGANCRGPLWVKGGITLESADGHNYVERNRRTLCRCGESANMPFCDATHLNCPHMEGFDE